MDKQQDAARRSTPRDTSAGHKTPRTRALGPHVPIRYGARVWAARPRGSQRQPHGKPSVVGGHLDASRWPGHTFRRVRTSLKPHTNPCVGGSVRLFNVIFSNSMQLALSRTYGNLNGYLYI